MLDSNIVLGIKSVLGCDGYEHGITTQSKDGWGCGVPVVFPKGYLDNKTNNIFKALTLMTPSQTAAGIGAVEIHTKNIVPAGFKPLYGNHKVIEVPEVSESKYDRMIQFIKDIGGVSLVVSTQWGKDKVTKTLFRMLSHWKYNSVFYNNSWGNRFLDDEDDKYIAVLTFLDLPYCVPLFNTRKVDGIGVSFCGATLNASREYGQLHRIFRTDLILTNYEDNIFYMDGIQINQYRPVDRGLYQQLSGAIGQTLPINDKSKKAREKTSSKWEKYKYNVESWEKAKAEWKEASVDVPNEYHAPMFDTGPDEAGPTIEIVHSTMDEVQDTPTFFGETPVETETDNSFYINTNDLTWENSGPLSLDGAETEPEGPDDEDHD